MAIFETNFAQMEKIMYPYYEFRQFPFICQKRQTHLRCITHLHDQVEMVCVRSGQVEVVIDAKCYLLEAGDVSIAFPNQVHAYNDIAENEADIFIFAPQYTAMFMQVFMQRMPVCPILRGALGEKELFLLDMLFEAFEGGDQYETEFLQGCLSAFLAKVLPKMELEKCDPPDMSSLKRILSYCNHHYKEPLSLDLLSRQLHVSKYYISHLMSGKLHISLRGYVNSLRVSEACRRMDAASSRSVTEIASEVGFDSLRTFNRAFVRHCNMTPSAYLKGGRAEKEKKGL